MNVNRYIRGYATLGPLGYLPASGTWATLVTIPFILCLPNTNDYEFMTAYLILFFLAYYAITTIVSKKSHEDPSEIVIDEVIGTLVTFSGLPLSPLIVILGFLLFRFFDISKIWPVYIFEKIPGASGILLDDMAAGFLSNVCLRAVLWYLNS